MSIVSVSVWNIIQCIKRELMNLSITCKHKTNAVYDTEQYAIHISHTSVLFYIITLP